MRSVKYIIIASIILSIPLYAHSSDLSVLRMGLLEGDVLLKTDDLNEWFPAAINMPLKEGDRINVPDSGRVEIQFADGSFLRLDENSYLVIHKAEKDSCQFYIEHGLAYVNYKGLGTSSIRIDTPITSVNVFDSSKFIIDVPKYSYTEISVLKGIVYTEDRNGKTWVSAGKTLSLREDMYADLSTMGPPDEWEKWNRGRDSKFEDSSYSSRYLPEELRYYSSDFDDNGKWVYVREYGYVWTPTVIISTGWAPYRYGRWVWIGSDYVWVSYDPWGWAPYHYGRWGFSISIGWYWVPPVRGAVYWGPGYVGWIHTPTYVAWVPLAPSDIYYGYGYYGPRSVNISIHNHKTVTKNVYKNVYINNAVTVVHKNTFIRGKHIDFKINKNPFLQKKMTFGRPDLKLVKASYMPVVSDVKINNQRIKSIRKNFAGELKKKGPGPFVKTTAVSSYKYKLPKKTSTATNLKQPVGKKPEKRINKEYGYLKKRLPSEKQNKIRHDSVKRKGNSQVLTKQYGRHSDSGYSTARQYSNNTKKAMRLDTVKRKRSSQVITKQYGRHSDSGYPTAKQYSKNPKKAQKVIQNTSSFKDRNNIKGTSSQKRWPNKIKKSSMFRR